MKLNNLIEFTILVVEDDELLMALNLSYIKDLFKEVYIATNGEEGIKIFKNKMPDIVLSDIYMPEKDGFEMAEEIKSYSPKTPIVFASSAYNEEVLLKAIKIGIDNYIVKPVQKDELLNVLSKIAENLIKTKLIEKKNRYIKVLFDTQPDITILTNGKKLLDANKRFFDFFDDFNSIQEFKQKYSCISELFEKVDKYGNVYDGIEGDNWIDFMLKHKRDVYKAVIKNKGKLYTFKITVNSVSIYENEYIINLTDITKYDLYKDNLFKENMEKDDVLMQQFRLAIMGETIGNIAHQWRQPLNALAILIQKNHLYFQRKALTEAIMQKSTDKAMNIITQMSKVIDDFRNFFKPNSVQENFNLSQIVTTTINMVEDTLSDKNIKIKLDSENIEILGHSSELSQVILNLINNSKDAILENSIKDGLIEINIYKNEYKVFIEISDNGKGIKKEIIDRVFEPYFSTKEESKGIGVGLYMTKTIIEKHMAGTIEIQNIENGAKFIITLPLDN